MFSSLQSLRNLQPGTMFKFSWPANHFKNLVLLRVSNSSATIGGEVREQGVWKSLGQSHTIDPNIIVNVLMIETTNNQSSLTMANTNESIKASAGATTAKQGRKPASYTVPKGQFTIKQAAEQNQILPTTMSAYLKKTYGDRLTKVGTVPSTGGKGKPANIYKIASANATAAVSA